MSTVTKLRVWLAVISIVATAGWACAAWAFKSQLDVSAKADRLAQSVTTAEGEVIRWKGQASQAYHRMLQATGVLPGGASLPTHAKANVMCQDRASGQLFEPVIDVGGQGLSCVR